MVNGDNKEEDFVSINAYDGEDADAAPFTRSAALARELADETDDDSDSDDEPTDDDNSEDEAAEDPELRDLLDNMDAYGGLSIDPTMHDGFVSSLIAGDQVVHVNQR